MMKILVLTPRFPYPVIGGDRLRIYELCRFLSQNHELDLLSLCEHENEIDSRVDDNVFNNVETIYLPKWQSYLNSFRAIFSSEPIQNSYYFSNKFERRYEEIIGEYDLVLCHLIRMANYVKDSNCYKLLEMTDAISLNYLRYKNVGGKFDLKSLIYKAEHSRVAKFELEAIDRFDGTFLVSDYDKNYLFPNGNEKLHVASNGVSVNCFSNNFNPESKKLIFIGNMYSSQNLDGAFWFAENVMPLLREIDEAYEFFVIGRIKDNDAKKLSNLSGVRVTGAVDNINEECDNSLAGICSVRLAAGVQNKTLEYMAMNLPVLSSEEGYQGLQARENDDILICKDAREFVSEIVKLSNNSELAKEIADNGKSYVDTYHSWSHKLESFEHVIDGFQFR